MISHANPYQASYWNGNKPRPSLYIDIPEGRFGPFKNWEDAERWVREWRNRSKYPTPRTPPPPNVVSQRGGNNTGTPPRERVSV